MKKLALLLPFAFLLSPLFAQEVSVTINEVTEKKDQILVYFYAKPEIAGSLDNFQAFLFVSFDGGRTFHQPKEAKLETPLTEKSINTFTWVPGKSPALAPVMKADNPVFMVMLFRKQNLIYGLTPPLKTVAPFVPKEHAAEKKTALTGKTVDAMYDAKAVNGAFVSLGQPPTCKDSGSELSFFFKAAKGTKEAFSDFFAYVMVSFDDGESFHLIEMDPSKVGANMVNAGENNLYWPVAKMPAYHPVLRNGPMLYRIGAMKKPAKITMPQAVLKRKSDLIAHAIDYFASTVTAYTGTRTPAQPVAEPAPSQPPAETPAAAPPDPAPLPPATLPLVFHHPNFSLRVTAFEKVQLPGETNAVLQAIVQVRRTTQRRFFDQLDGLSHRMTAKARDASGVLSDVVLWGGMIVWDSYTLTRTQEGVIIREEVPCFRRIAYGSPLPPETRWEGEDVMMGRITFRDVRVNAANIVSIDTLSFNFDNTVTTQDLRGFTVSGSPLRPPFISYPQKVYAGGIFFTIDGARNYVRQSGSTSVNVVEFQMKIRNLHPSEGEIWFTQPGFPYHIDLNYSAAGRTNTTTLAAQSIIWNSTNDINLNFQIDYMREERAGVIRAALDRAEHVVESINSLVLRFNNQEITVDGKRLPVFR